MASGLALVVDNDAAEAVEPGKSAFHDPAPGHWYEAAPGGWWTAGYVMLPAQRLHLSRKISLVRFVRQYTTQAASPSWTQLISVGQQGLRPAAVVVISRVHHDAPTSPTGVAEHLALAPIDALVRIQAALLAQAGG